MSHACSDCAARVETPRRGPTPKRCSTCKQALARSRGRAAWAPRSSVRYADCSECGRAFVSRKRGGCPPKTCGEVCRKAQEHRRTREYLAAYTATHGISYATARYGDRRREADRTRHLTPEGREARRRNDAIRRARRAGATVEVFDNAEIFERDAWTCGICSGSVDRELCYPDPMSASLDHVVPLAHGGDHSRTNTRLAHLTCNVRRGAARGENVAA